MPRIGLPCGCTPSRSRWRSVCGISPSPQALSIDALAPFGDNDFQPGPSAVNRGSQPGRAAADDEKVDHVRPASAAFSTLTRVLSSHALSAENTNAVIHAVCTNGNATPSAITAT